MTLVDAVSRVSLDGVFQMSRKCQEITFHGLSLANVVWSGSLRDMRGGATTKPTREKMKLKVQTITPCLSCGKKNIEHQDAHPSYEHDGGVVCTPCAVAERAALDATAQATLVGLVIQDILGNRVPVRGEA